MEAIILIGIPASGKSTYCRQNLFDSHVRINRDMLRTRHRAAVLLQACAGAGIAFVSDNTNVSVAERAPVIATARAAGMRVLGLYFQSNVADCAERNDGRDERSRVPGVAIGARKRDLELPRLDEGFTELRFVRVDGRGGFVESPWQADG